MPLTYHTNQRGVPGYSVSITQASPTGGNVSNTGVIPAMVLTDETGAAVASGGAITVQPGPSGTSPVTGSFTATGTSALFTSIPGHAVWVKLSGTFTASVQVERCSTGLAASAQKLTVAGADWAVFTVPVQEAVSSEDDGGVAYRLNCTAYTSGTIAYQIGHK